MNSILQKILAGPDNGKLRSKIGIEPFEFLEEYAKNLFILSEKLFAHHEKSILYNDYSFLIFPAAKAFEGYLKKLIKIKQLASSPNFNIGNIFNPQNTDKNSKVTSSLRDKKYRKVIDKISAEWDFCRNKIMHYDEDFLISSIEKAQKNYSRIIETIKDSYVAYVGPISYPQFKPLPNVEPQRRDPSVLADALRILRDKPRKLL